MLIWDGSMETLVHTAGIDYLHVQSLLAKS